MEIISFVINLLFLVALFHTMYHYWEGEREKHGKEMFFRSFKMYGTKEFWLR